jgi:hypothetical protein
MPAMLPELWLFYSPLHWHYPQNGSCGVENGASAQIRFGSLIF